MAIKLFRNIAGDNSDPLWIPTNVARYAVSLDDQKWINLDDRFARIGETYSGTEGSVIFIGSDGLLTEDNDDFFFKQSTSSLGINAGTNPTANLHINGTVRFQGLSGTGTALTIDSDGYITKTTAFTGTVTSVGLTAPTGFSISGSPVTTTGTLGITNSFTAGSVVFAMGTGFAQDNSNFFWDDTNNRLGLGIASPLARLHIKNPATGSTINALYAETSASANILQVASDSAAVFALLGNASFAENTFRVNGPSAPTATGITYSVTGVDKFRSHIRSDNNFQFTAVDAGSSSIGGFHIETATGKLLLKEKIYQYNAVAPTNGQILMGHTANGSFELGSLTAGSGVTITPGAGSISIAATGLGGTVTSFSAGDLSPLFTTSEATITTTPALTFTLSNAAANTWFGNNTSGSTTPSFNAFGTGVNIWMTTPSSANLATAITDETGSGSLVFANTPTLVTPILGVFTGTSGTITNTTAGNIVFSINGASGQTQKMLEVVSNGGYTYTKIGATGKFDISRELNDGTPSLYVQNSHASYTGVLQGWLNSVGTVAELDITGKFIKYGGSVATNGQLLIGNTSTGRWDVGTLTAGNGITITNGAGSVTIASLGYALQAMAGQFNPADSTSYYFGINPQTGGSTATLSKLRIPKAGTIKACYVDFTVTGAGTAETSTVAIRLNNSTDTTVSASTKQDATTTAFSNTALAIAVVAGDYIEIKWTTPAWVTNPTGVKLAVVIYIE